MRLNCPAHLHSVRPLRVRLSTPSSILHAREGDKHGDASRVSLRCAGSTSRRALSARLRKWRGPECSERGVRICALVDGQPDRVRRGEPELFGCAPESKVDHDKPGAVSDAWWPRGQASGCGHGWWEQAYRVHVACSGRARRRAMGGVGGVTFLLGSAASQCTLHMPADEMTRRESRVAPFSRRTPLMLPSGAVVIAATGARVSTRPPYASMQRTRAPETAEGPPRG
jgi:hypothetical protein